MNAPKDPNGLREALARAVATNLKRRRNELGLSLQGVAAAAGLTKAHVWSLETGRQANPSLRAIVGLAAALRASVPELLGLEVAAEAEITRLKEGMEAAVGALKLAENPLSYRNAVDPSGPGSIAVARALDAVRSALAQNYRTGEA